MNRVGKRNWALTLWCVLSLFIFLFFDGFEEIIASCGASFLLVGLLSFSIFTTFDRTDNALSFGFISVGVAFIILGFQRLFDHFSMYPHIFCFLSVVAMIVVIVKDCGLTDRYLQRKTMRNVVLCIPVVGGVYWRLSHISD